jgi:hypothetical protein
MMRLHFARLCHTRQHKIAPQMADDWELLFILH